MQDCNIFEIWEEYKQTLYGFIRKNVPNSDEASDILQDVLLKCYQFCSQGKTVRSVKSWLFKVTQNTIIDHHRMRLKDQNLETTTHIDDGEDDMLGEASAYIKALLRLLPEQYAQPLYLHDLENISQKEIAGRLNLSLSNTKSRILRGRIKLKERFLECCAVEFNDAGKMTGFDIKPHCKELQAEKLRLEKIS